jgi:carotenoid cleavage dioxygenase
MGGTVAPCRVEGEVYDLEIFGKIPKQMNGTFYRVMPDPGQPPTYHKNGEMFVPLDGDGVVSAFVFEDGHVDWRQRFVQTARYQAEKKARKSLFGVYRNPFTNHPCVDAVVDSTGNTNVLVHAGKLLALKENGQAWEMDPGEFPRQGYIHSRPNVSNYARPSVTLKTRGYNPFGMASRTFTAHPKLDVQTGNLVGFGYEARGLATRDICYFELDPSGKVVEELFFEYPFIGFMHDCILSEDETFLNVARM